MRFLKIFPIALAVVFLTSCSTAYYFSDFITPSEVYIPSKIYAVGVINRGADPDMPAMIYSAGVPVSGIKGLPLKVANRTLTDLSEQIEKLNRFKMVSIEWSNLKKDPDRFMEAPFTAAQIDSICNANRVDGLVVLEGVELQLNTEGEVNVVTTVDAAGMPVRVPEFTSTQQASYTVAWRFYDGLQLKVADTYQQNYQRYFNKVAYDPNAAAEVNPEEMQLFDIATLAARDYHDRIAPHWVSDYRLYYKGNTADMILISKKLEHDGDWTNAAREWMKLTKSDNEKERYQANFNMAVASEMLGRPRVAREWLIKARAIRETGRVQKYDAILKKQILIYDVVDRQLGLDDAN